MLKITTVATTTDEPLPQVVREFTDEEKQIIYVLEHPECDIELVGCLAESELFNGSSARRARRVPRQETLVDREGLIYMSLAHQFCEASRRHFDYDKSHPFWIDQREMWAIKSSKRQQRTWGRDPDYLGPMASPYAWASTLSEEDRLWPTRTFDEMWEEHYEAHKVITAKRKLTIAEQMKRQVMEAGE